MFDVVAAIRARLVAASVTGASKTYFGKAEAGVTYPYIIVELIGGGQRNWTTGNMRREIWQVCVQTNNFTDARTISGAIVSALHQQESSLSTLLSTGTVYACWQTQYIFLEDNINNEDVYYAGARFDIRLAET